MNGWVIGFMVAIILALVSIDNKVADLVKKQSVSSFALYTFEDKSGMWYRLRLEDLRVLEVNKGTVPLPTEFRCSSSVDEIAEKYIDKIERMEP